MSTSPARTGLRSIYAMTRHTAGHWTRVVASLPQVAATGRSSIPIARVIAVNPTQGARQRFAGSRHSEQMDVIAHEAPGPNLQSMLTRVFAQELQVDVMVLRVVEDGLPAIAACAKVVRVSLAGRGPRGSRGRAALPLRRPLRRRAPG